VFFSICALAAVIEKIGLFIEEMTSFLENYCANENNLPFLGMNRIVQTSTWWQIFLWAGGLAFVPYAIAQAVAFPFLSLEQSFYNFIGLALVVIINVEVLLPQFYFKEKGLLYLVSAFCLVLMVATITYWDGPTWNRSPMIPLRGEGRHFMGRMGQFGRYFRLIGRGMPYFMVLIGSSVVAIGEFARQKEKRAIQLEKEKLETEMKFLKSQINPHFLFNALNNIYTLTLIKSDKAPVHLLRLSDMLRYMLYDCKVDQVPLHAELDYLRNYIEMKLLKDSEGLNVEVFLQEDPPKLTIAPLIFIPFVENAFKHSRIEDLKNGWIKVELITIGKEVRFCVKNSVPAQNSTVDEVGGIGLDNVRRRLDLIYPGRYFLDIEKKTQQFNVQLNIELA